MSIGQLESISQLESGCRSRSHLATQDERGGSCSAAAGQDEPRPERMAFRTNRASKAPFSVCCLTNGPDVDDLATRNSSLDDKNPNVCRTEDAEAQAEKGEAQRHRGTAGQRVIERLLTGAHVNRRYAQGKKIEQAAFADSIPSSPWSPPTRKFA